MTLLRKFAAPEAEWRRTTISTFIISMLRAVSLSVSPFETLLVSDETLRTYAERRRAASSNEVLVRVELSKNRLTIVFPWRVGTFFIGRSRISRKVVAVFRISSMSLFG